jgi:hypothetical protein
MASYAVLSGDIVSNIIVADLQNVAEEVTGAECVKCDNTNIKIGDYYDRKWSVLVPANLVYEPISKKFMSPEEMEAY